MSDGLEKLRALGAQKIHEQTHIVRQHVQAVLHETFDQMNKVQFLGFISILEREYNVDLSDLRAKGEEFFGVKIVSNEKSEVFVSPKKIKSYKFVYIIAILLIIITLFTLNISLDTTSITKVQLIDNSAIDIAKDSMANNATLKENNKTIIEDNIVPEVEPEPEVIEVVKSFKIIPKSKLWLGYIDLQTHRKYQSTFKDELSLDPEKNWLLVFGHTNINIEVDGKEIEPQSKQKIRFLYQDSVLTNISLEEFKELNRGKKW